MRWRDARRSSNVEDVRGARRGGLGIGGLGIGGVVAVVGIGWLLGISPGQMLGMLSRLEGGAPVGQQQGRPPPANDESAEFIRAILGETEDVWGTIFQKSGNSYEQPKLILFSGAVRSACGSASSAMGPFYCPGDHRVYLDLSFFDEMKARLGGGGDFAYAYVIAHEVGHHVQTLLGVSAKVQQAHARGQDVSGADGLSVRQELQADCFAGVWANYAQTRHQWLEAGDVEEALNTASAIGDDRLQQQTQGTVVPDAFTHGSATQRVRWFRTGFDSGEVGRCDTFAAPQL
jgi:hypothetical protein